MRDASRPYPSGLSGRGSDGEDRSADLFFIYSSRTTLDHTGKAAGSDRRSDGRFQRPSAQWAVEPAMEQQLSQECARRTTAH